MKVKDIVEIINKNAELTNKIVEYNKNLSTLQYLDMNGNVKEELKNVIVTGNKSLYDVVNSEENQEKFSLLRNERTIIKVNKPKLEETIKQYKQWLESEI